MKPIHLFSATILLLAACKESQSETKSTSAEIPAAEKTLLESVLNTAPKGDAKSIKDVKAAAKPGDEVTFKGRIMGNDKPFVVGRAAFIVADPSLITACSDKPGDGCETPWDACCDTAEDKKKATVTVQILNSEGRVLKQGLEGTKGLANLATVTVSGTIAEGSGGDVLIVNANAIQLTP
jgi:hypothetical protein